jgi:hypothetical protein
MVYHRDEIVSLLKQILNNVEAEFKQSYYYRDGENPPNFDMCMEQFRYEIENAIAGLKNFGD